MQQNNLFLLPIFCFTLLLCAVGCKKGETAAAEATETATAADDQKIADYLVSGYNFLAKDIVETESGFMVQGDIFFPKKDFWANYQLPNDVAGKNYRSYNLVTATRNITIAVATNVPSTWRTAITSAASKWNARNGKLTFSVITANYCPVNGITVVYSSLGSSQNSTFASAGFPTSGGVPHHTITINSTCTVAMTAAQKLKTAVHEVGHCIGFMHTDNTSGNLVVSTTSACNSTDAASVMRQGLMSFSDFSTCDKAAYTKLYPR